MKKFIRGIYLGIFCLILLQPVHGIAEEASAKFGIQRDEAIFRIKNFEAASGEYRLLLFAEAKLAEKSVWVCIDERTYDTQELTENYLNGQGRIEDMPYAESVAVKLFAESGSVWEDCFGLCESRTHFSEDTYSVQVENEDADKETPELYVLIEDDSTILPLKMAEELYGFKEMPQKGSLVFIAPDGLFLDDPVVFICAEKDENGILLKKYAKEVSVRKLAEIRTEETTGEAAQEETETETQETADTESEELTERETVQEETEARKTTETETEPQTAKRMSAKPQNPVETETKKDTETEMQKAAETETQKASETETQKAAETEMQKASKAETQKATETETQKATETETQKATGTETQIAPEAETQKITETGKKTAGKIMLAVPVLAVLILLAVCIVSFLKGKKKEKAAAERVRVRRNLPPRTDDEDETTIEPVKSPAAAEEICEIQAAVINNKGRVRKNNEDNFYFNGKYMRRAEMDDGALISDSFRDDVQVYAVCDGMGGADAGEEASHRAVKELALRKQEHSGMRGHGELKSVLRSISEKISQEAMQREQKSGTTIVMMVVSGGRAVFANVGDSRIYRFRDRKLTQISLDHSRVQRMVSMGILTPEQARTDPGRHVITQYLGMASDIKISPHITEEKLCKGDVYILCSDGLTDMVEDVQIEAILQEKENLREAVQELLKTALKNGGRDNVTIMLLRS